ncbi:bifunctional RNase H/acid phosphatase [Streptomyces sp. NPDC095613]|uniref:bifunctional RNase H/acid phosphatase n=1 Tax=Streptomyces sp. NPDC095613 TaxID=3155540 RepID=UPI00331A4D6E
MAELVVEADGGSRGNPGPAGYGAVVLDPRTGRALAEVAEYLGTATNNVAEYRGLLAGLKAAKALGPAARIRVRMDSKLAVEQMSGRWKIKHPDLRPLAAEAARVFPAEQVTYEWIPRERNKHADRLANEAMDAGARGERWEAPSAVSGRPGPGGAPGAEAEAESGSAEGAGTGVADGVAAAEAAGAAGTAPADAAPADAGTVAAASGTHVAGTHVAGTQAGTDTGADTGAGVATEARTGVTAAVAESGPAVLSTETSSVGWGPADLGPPAVFVLLRHGETVLTPEKRFSGSGGTDPELSPVGRRQAEAIAASLAERGTVQDIVSSPLRRCRETAAAVAARLGLEVTVEDGLREADFGAWEGLTFAETQDRYPDDLNAWLASPSVAPTGGGESFATVARRIQATRDRLLERYRGRTVLLVTHVTPVKTLVQLALGAPLESLFRMELSAASVSVVAYYADGNASVRLLNDTSHLR